MRHTRRTLLAALATALLLISGGATAQAGDGLCNAGYSCVYQHLSYDGELYGSAKNTVTFWGKLSWNDKATSISANGKQCRQTRFYEHAADTNGQPYGAYVTLNSRTWSSTFNRDPDLRNGAWTVTSDFNDRISGFVHTSCG